MTEVNDSVKDKLTRQQLVNTDLNLTTCLCHHGIQSFRHTVVSSRLFSCDELTGG